MHAPSITKELYPAARASARHCSKFSGFHWLGAPAATVSGHGSAVPPPLLEKQPTKTNSSELLIQLFEAMLSSPFERRCWHSLEACVYNSDGVNVLHFERRCLNWGETASFLTVLAMPEPCLGPLALRDVRALVDGHLLLLHRVDRRQFKVVLLAVCPALLPRHRVWDRLVLAIE